jgi:hypothetical protein
VALFHSRLAPSRERVNAVLVRVQATSAPAMRKCSRNVALAISGEARIMANGIAVTVH